MKIERCHLFMMYNDAQNKVIRILCKGSSINYVVSKAAIFDKYPPPSPLSFFWLSKVYLVNRLWATPFPYRDDSLWMAPMVLTKFRYSRDQIFVGSSWILLKGTSINDVWPFLDPFDHPILFTLDVWFFDPYHLLAFYRLFYNWES